MTRSTPEVVTNRMVLRRATADHVQDWAERVFADPEVIRYMPKRDITPLERAQRALGVYDRLWAERPVGGWVLVDGKSEELIGSCEIEYLDGSGEWELGYALARSVWGQGLATEAAEAATRFGFEHAGLQRIMAVVVPENVASWKVLEKLGFVFERRDVYYDLDIEYYAISRDGFHHSDARFEVIWDR